MTVRVITIAALASLGGLLLYAERGLPNRGDPAAPALGHVAPYYIEHAEEQTHTPNIVTAVLADYRGFDTLGETTVIFTAGLACYFILRSRSVSASGASPAAARAEKEQDEENEVEAPVTR